MENKLYKKGILLFIRYFSLFAVFLLIVVTTIRFYKVVIVQSEKFLTFYNVTTFIENSFSIILLSFAVIFPHKIELIGIVSFIYSCECLLWDVNNPLGILMYALGNVILYVRGFFIRKAKIKMIISTFIFIALLLTGIHFGLSLFLDSLMNKLGYTLVLSIIIFLLINKINNETSISSEPEKILNLAVFPGIREDDVLLLQKVLANKQYKEIASEVFRSEGTVRNRLNKVYDLLGVMDRMGFITTYTGYEIVYKSAEENISNTSVNDSDVEINTVAGLKNSIDKLSSILKKKKDVLHL